MERATIRRFISSSILYSRASVILSQCIGNFMREADPHAGTIQEEG